MSLGHGEDHGVLHGAGVKFRRADQVADVFQDGEVHVVHAQALQALTRHARVQVAHAAGVELNDLGAGLLNGGGVHVGINVRLHDADAKLVLQRGDGLAQRGGLAGAGGAHQVEQEHAVLFQLLAQLVRLTVVVFKYALLYLKNSVAFDSACHLNSNYRLARSV